MVINIYPTLKCNLECKHCMHNCSPSRTEELSIGNYKLFKTFIDYVMRKGIRIDSICISGGEPFLYSNIYQLLLDLNALRMRYGIRISMCTNGTTPPSKEFLDKLGELDFILSIIRVSSSPFHDEQIAQRGLKLHMRELLKLSQNIETHRVVRIMDKGRAKELIKNNSNEFIDPSKTCFSRFNPSEEVNFKPNFISFCSEDDSLLVPEKYVFYDYFKSFVNSDLAFDELIIKSRNYKTKQMLNLCPNQCVHYTITKNYINSTQE